MTGRFENTSSQPRRRKRRPKWQRVLRRYWPPIRFGLICLLILALLVGFVSLVVKLISTAVRDDTPNSNEDTVMSTAETTIDISEQQAMVDALLEEAAAMVAGYDYLGAIDMLRNSAFFADYPELQSRITEYQQLDSQLVSYADMNNITHVFFHSLIVDTDRCFDGEYTAGGYNQYMTTIDEFIAMMESMYEKGYVLVSPYDIAYEVSDANGTRFVYGDIRLPAGKIPFLMSQDDLNYYGYMIGDIDGTNEIPAVVSPNGDGFAHKMVIGEDGYPTCEYMDANGNVTTGDYDLVPVLERFIQEHPDFSYHGARAILGMTGYEGVFGYRTKPSYEAALGTSTFQREIQQAREVADCLREHGWILASHSYGHPYYGNISAERVEADSDKWENTVETVIGEVDVILYPNGSDIAGIEYYSTDNQKFNALYEDGYRYFFNVDSHYAWCQLGDNYYRGGRRNLDGYRMYYDPEDLSDLFDVSKVFDPARPTPVPPI